ncbi:MAG: phage holin family protein [Xanthomonadaceae bacterium]|nr:phage holin family protein [Rhodospirillaceae bacterium]NIA17770.1 phage holin family protein [Xanthomonadaceae bacterium]
MNLLLKWLIMVLSILISAYLIPGVWISGAWAALWLAIFLGLANIILKPILILITLPISILTLGLFTFVINGLLILLGSTIIKGFYVKGFWWAMLFSIVLSIISYFLNNIFNINKNNN